MVEVGGALVLGRGLPRAWLVAGAGFGCEGLPTDPGAVTWSARVSDDGSLDLRYDGRPGHRFGLPT